MTMTAAFDESSSIDDWQPSTSPEELQACVARADYHQALQLLGRPSFSPGDGSWTEWIFLQMHAAHCDYCGDSGPSIHRFLTLVATEEATKLSLQEHELRWRCYYDLCTYLRRPVLPVVYYTAFLPTAPQDLAIAMARISDLQGLDIVLSYFPMGCTALLKEIPPTLEAPCYAHLIPWEAEGVQEFLKDHIRERFRHTGQIRDWIETVEQELGAECDLFHYLSEEYSRFLMEEEEGLSKSMESTPPELALPETFSAPTVEDITGKYVLDEEDNSGNARKPQFHQQNDSSTILSESILDEGLLQSSDCICLNELTDLENIELTYDLQVELKTSHERDPNSEPEHFHSAERDSHIAGTLLHNLEQQVLRLQQDSYEKDQLIQQLQDQVEAMQHDHALHKTADQARMEYLLSSSSQRNNSINKTPGIPAATHSNAETNATTNEELQQLAYALEVSERQRAQALEDLQEQREFYADKMKQLQEAFRRMIHAEELYSTPIEFGKRHV